MWYILYVTDTFSNIQTYYVRVENKWDLFAYIGYLYSTSLVKIERISYMEAKEDNYIEPAKILSNTIKELFRQK